MAAIADQQLLFGLLALQNGLIDQGQLVAAFQAWTREKNKPLAGHLKDRGDLDSADRAVVEALVGRHIARHDNAAEQSLAVMGVGQTARAGLAALGDPAIEASLGHVRPEPRATDAVRK
jgi:serine/threonine-protein kinase